MPPRLDSVSAFKDKFDINCYENTGAKLRTPKVKDDLVASLGSTVNTTRRQFLGTNLIEEGFTTSSHPRCNWEICGLTCRNQETDIQKTRDCFGRYAECIITER